MPALTLDSSVRFIKGVGPRRAEALAELNIHTVRDLIEHLPFRYGRESAARPIRQLRPDTSATVVGVVSDARVSRRGPRGPIRVCLEDETASCQAVWFESPWLAERLNLGDRIRLHGKVREYQGAPEFVNPRIEWVGQDGGRAFDQERFEPIYPACAGLASRQLMRWVRQALAEVRPQIEELFDSGLLRVRRLPARDDAYCLVHAPRRKNDAEEARRRLAYDELMLMQLVLAMKREHHRRTARAEPIRVTDEVDRRIRRRLRFTFTRAQERVIAEIRHDLARAWPMRRLLQGDVGAGKTAVAVYAAMAVVARRQQTAIMAPTEILARQHYANVERYLADSRVRRVLLVGGMPARERSQRQRDVAAGAIDLVVGTHALLEKEITFAALGLVVIDEQHKFGVRQRAVLSRKGVQPHLLTMSATPIPRSLAMTAFGELDISVIDELPPGRTPVTTRLIAPVNLEHAWEFVRRQLHAGRQAYVVYPLIEESEAMPLRAASQEVHRLSGHELRGHRVALLHGRMKPEEKQAIMDDFRDRRIDVLAATTVVEVGLDVPNATVMVIQHADRYGLSQLHQLRGRIGRGTHAGTCLLMTDSHSADAHRRLGVLVRTADGFQVAEEDLRERGPGQMLGTRQHGAAGLRVARLPDDFDLLEWAASDARRILSRDPFLADRNRTALRRELLRRHRESLALLDAG